MAMEEAEELELEAEAYAHVMEAHEGEHTSADPDCAICERDREDAFLEELEEAHEKHTTCGLDLKCVFCQEAHEFHFDVPLGATEVILQPQFTDCEYCRFYWEGAQS